MDISFNLLYSTCDSIPLLAEFGYFWNAYYENKYTWSLNRSIKYQGIAHKANEPVLELWAMICVITYVHSAVNHNNGNFNYPCSNTGVYIKLGLNYNNNTRDCDVVPHDWDSCTKKMYIHMTPM